MKKLLLICLCIFAIGETAKAQNQVLWGLTPYGGQFGGGTLLSINNDGTGFNLMHQFQPPDGFTPFGNLLQASNGSLYGTCYNGGSFASCTIFRFDPSTGTYTDVYSFDIVHGDYPRSGVLEASNGKLYGAASSGGSGFNGVIYSFDPVTNTYTDEFDFNMTTGRMPWGCPLNVNDVLYGLASDGGAHMAGVLYSYDISTDTYTDLFDFDPALGSNPFGSLILAANGKLYGMASAGGINSKGVIFSFDPATNVYAKLFDFGGANGNLPEGSLFEASNGLLYGVTKLGGMSGDGVLFSFNPVNNMYVKLIDFNGANGSVPSGELMQGSNGKLYGSTTSGGAFTYGNMFSYDPASGTLADLFDFSIATGYGSTGTFTVVTATGIEQLNGFEGQLSFYPNPVKDKMTLQLNFDEQKKVDIHLINAIGEHIYSFTENNAGIAYRKTINLSKYENGIYFLECIVDGEKTVTKLVKQ
ncbi:MAG TPA: choice-of-anchor tandem repeat GloVer-containing protein [Bacteroidia bacterium]|nr:choice-of-anchor tandem repeat GloVer-containing protein [Bacteroidia bacterium]